MAIERLVVVGAAGGGVAALMRLVHALPPEFDAPMLITLQIGAQRSVLPQLLGQTGHRDVAYAAGDEAIAPHTIRIAPPDQHLVVHDDRLQTTRGPKENCARPAVDPLFRSAAAAHGAHVVGVVLTGQLDDGTNGLQEIKRHGGTTIVQDPSDAEEPSMPQSAIEHLDVDHVLPLDLIPLLLTSLASKPPQPPQPPAREAGAGSAGSEMRVARGTPESLQELQNIGQPSAYACPECHGALWQILDSRPQRFRCHTGHAFTARSLQHAMASAFDAAGWSALRALQERSFLLHQLATLERGAGHDEKADRMESNAEHIKHQIEVLNRLLRDAPDVGE